MKNIYLVFALFVLLITSSAADAQIGWRKQNLQYLNLNKNLKCIYAFNKMDAFISGDSGFTASTTNGGKNWNITNISTVCSLDKIKFFNSSTGYYAGGKIYEGEINTTNIVIYKTTNSGYSFLKIFDEIIFGSAEITGIDFFDGNSGFVTMKGWGTGNTIGGLIKTTNGGVNWVLTADNISRNDIALFNSGTGYISGNFAYDVGGYDTAYIFKTTDYGSTFSTLTKRFDIHYDKFHFTDINTGKVLFRVINSNINYLASTIDGGINWSQTLFPYNFVNDIIFINQNKGFASLNGIFYTNNSGLNWITQIEGFGITNINSISMVDSIYGWAVGNNSIILHTNTGGNTLPPDTASARYFPLSVGNVFLYKYYSIYLTDSTITRAVISKDTLISGKKYFYCQGFPYIGTNWVRYDTASGNLLAYYPGQGCGQYPNDKIIDSLGSGPGDRITCTFVAFMWRIAADTQIMNVFNFPNVSTKGFNYDGLIVGTGRYAKNFGLISYGWGEPPPVTEYQFMKGCVINGTVYGDTVSFPRYIISGNVKFSDNLLAVNSGYVKAIKINRATGEIIKLDSVQIQPDGSYSLNYVRNDSVYIGAYPNSTPVVDFVPTYHPSSIQWQNAIRLFPVSNLNNVNINVHRLSVFSENSGVSGKVLKYNDKTFPSLSDAYIYVKEGNIFRGFSKNDINGNYLIQNLPSGAVKIFIDRLGYGSDSTQIFLIANQISDSVNFYLSRTYTDIENKITKIPLEYKLGQNYPNPFNSATNIEFKMLNSGYVKIEIYDLLGRKVLNIFNGWKEAGSHQVRFDANNYGYGELSSGVYYYKMTTEKYSEIKLMVLLK